MKLNELTYTPGSRYVAKRKCRGIGSGKGKNGGSGHKGQKSRSGGGVRLGFEGGQNPLYRRLPKRGFHNFTTKEYAIVNVCDLNKFDANSVVNLEALVAKHLIDNVNQLVKVLGNGTLNVALTVSAHKFSKSADEAINNAGGQVEVL